MGCCRRRCSQERVSLREEEEEEGVRELRGTLLVL
jgi:hypothetical protein